MTRESVVADATEAYVQAFIHKEYVPGCQLPTHSADTILMRLTPDYNVDPAHTELYHTLYEEVVERGQDILVERLRAMARICKRDGCDMPLNRRQEHYCSRDCSGVDNGKKRSASRVRPAEVDRIVRLYESGLSIESVGAEVNRSIGAVARALKARGVRFRSRGFRAEIHRYRTCEWCDGTFEKGRTESWQRFLKRRYCDPTCYNEARKSSDPRICDRCGEQYQRRTGEGHATWSARKYCSTDCAHRARVAA